LPAAELPLSWANVVAGCVVRTRRVLASPPAGRQFLECAVKVAERLVEGTGASGACCP
jgi:hypothetical protein